MVKNVSFVVNYIFDESFVGRREKGKLLETEKKMKI